MMIEKVEFKGFKSIKDAEVVCKKIVGIWGRNGIGKSTFLHGIIWALSHGNFMKYGIPFENFDKLRTKYQPNQLTQVSVYIDQDPITKQQIHKIAKLNDVSQPIYPIFRTFEIAKT